jgi:hypothetical protein
MPDRNVRRLSHQIPAVTLCTIPDATNRTIRMMSPHPITGDSAEMDRPRNAADYQIRVRGRLGDTLLAAFPGLHARAEGDDTVLAGALPDQAALYGVLAQVEALGLELLEVRRARS